MKDFKIDNKGTGQIFRNRYLENLTRTHFAFPVILYFSLAAFVLLYGILVKDINVFSRIYLFPLGIIFFTLIEYLIHRFIFHFKTETEKERNLQYTIHGVHHEFPKDKDRLVMPPILSIVLAVFFYFLFKITMGDNTYIFYPGVVAGYSIYLLIHFAVHRYRPPNNFFKYLWKHHSLHHYKSTDAYFSVSFPVWDYIFGTIPPGKQDKAIENKLPDVI